MKGEIYIEIVSVGRMLKVVAVDSATGLEATVIAPSATPRSDLERVAVRKLQRLVAREVPEPQRRARPR